MKLVSSGTARTADFGLMAGLAQRPSAFNVAVVVCLLFTGMALFTLGTDNTAGCSTTSVRLKFGEAAVNTPSRNSPKDVERRRSLDSYNEAATRNLTGFRDRLLSISIPFFGVSKASKGRRNATGLWKLLEPIISCPPDQPLTRYGPEGDGSKLLCKLPEQDGSACVIYSLGSNGNYDFERSVLSSTSCLIYTFDCTYQGVPQGPRHSYYKWCVGDAEHGADFRSWANITATLGHSKVDVLKIDIEGHEYKVFSDWSSKEPTLPSQIAVEFHFQDINSTLMAQNSFMAQTGAELAFAYLHLGNLGYAGISQEINPLGPDCCSEAGFLKIT